MNLLNQPLSWDPNLYVWNPNQNIRGFANASQLFGSTQSEPYFVPETQTETQPKIEETNAFKTYTMSHPNRWRKHRDETNKLFKSIITLFVTIFK
ncbi:hypothetical protein Hanom_Chr03g00198801 [Helianthus anomalus]